AIEDLQRNGLAIHTNFDPLVQRRLEEAVATAYPRIQNQQAMDQQELEQLEAAAVVSSVETGEVLAMIGGREPRYAGFNRALDAKRPIGSLVKPAVYLTALEQPQRYNLATPLTDGPIAIEQPDGSLWEPENFSEESHGQVSLLRGLSKSLNQATVNLGIELGVENVLQTVKRLGYESEVEALPSALLGAVEMAPLDVLGMYQTIAGNGFRVPRRVIRSIQAQDGELLKRYPLALEKRFDAAPIHQLQFAMQTVMRSGTGRRAYWYNPPEVAFAGKTGTSNDQRDSWFAGFGGDHLAVVWMGRDDNLPTPVTGSSGALEVWSAFMAASGERGLTARTPANIVYRQTDISNARLVPERCTGAVALPYQEASLATMEESRIWCR
ncbi:MAG: penicillin-binding transpeptidase domain-containing protein, partial [Granulosicoccaceae bacterium]